MRAHVIRHLIDAARRRRDDAATRRARAAGARQNAAQTLDSLQAYRVDHLKRRTDENANTDAGRLQLHRSFGKKLDQAISSQSQQTEGLTRALSARDAEVLDTQRRLKAFELLEKRRRRALERRVESAEQAMHDEFNATRRALRKDRNDDP